MTITERAEKMADEIIYLVAMYDSMHRKPYLVELCEDALRGTALEARVAERKIVSNHWPPLPALRSTMLLECWIADRLAEQELRLKSLTKDLEYSDDYVNWCLKEHK